MQKPEQCMFTERRTLDHEVVLEFNYDREAEAFDYWWNTEGWEAFRAYAEAFFRDVLGGGD